MRPLHRQPAPTSCWGCANDVLPVVMMWAWIDRRPACSIPGQQPRATSSSLLAAVDHWQPQRRAGGHPGRRLYTHRDWILDRAAMPAVRWTCGAPCLGESRERLIIRRQEICRLPFHKRNRPRPLTSHGSATGGPRRAICRCAQRARASPRAPEQQPRRCAVNFALMLSVPGAFDHVVACSRCTLPYYTRAGACRACPG